MPAWYGKSQKCMLVFQARMWAFPTRNTFHGTRCSTMYTVAWIRS